MRDVSSSGVGGTSTIAALDELASADAMPKCWL